MKKYKTVEVVRQALEDPTSESVALALIALDRIEEALNSLTDMRKDPDA